MNHLHVHSDYSVLDGYSTIDEIIDRVYVLSQNAVALTDHGTLGGIVEFYQKATAKGIKPILGCEFYFIAGESYTKEAKRYHITVLASNEVGYQNLLKLSYISYADGFYYKPRIHLGLLKQYHEGLIVTTGCLQGIIPQKLLHDDLEGAKRLIQTFLDIFGDRFYIEIQDHKLAAQRKVNKYLVELARQYHIKMIAANDAHYSTKEHAIYHDILLAIQTGHGDKSKRLRMQDDAGQLLSEFYIKSEDEMRKLPTFSELPECILNTHEVAERCNVSIKFSEKLKLPCVKTVEHFYDYALCKLRERVGIVTAEMEERLRYEVKVIERLGYVDYFLLVEDIVNIADSHGISRGPARGSAGGSLVAYALGITHINPLRHNLLFERFLNPERVSPPDIDIDFEDSKRELLIELIRQKYGANNVAHIATYMRMGAKAALRDVARFYNMSNQVIDQFIKGTIPDKPNISFEDIEDKDKNPYYIKYIQKISDPRLEYHRIIQPAKNLSGRIRQSGRHASAIVITANNLYDVLPAMVIKEDNKKQLVTQIEYEYCEKLGFVKVDILGLKTLSLIKRILEALQKRNIHIDLSNIGLNDPKVYELFQSGLTTGVFQFESQGMKMYLRKLKPDRIEDIIALNALYRPGPIEEIDRYIRRKQGQEHVVYPDERLQKVLEETYGIIVYQEQIMEIAKIIANYTLAEADNLRRAIGKKIREIIENNREQFINRAVNNNTPRERAEYIFDLIEKFAEYGFNKSHATGYAYLAYQTAYLKRYYPAVFFATLIDLYKNDKSYLRDIYLEAEALGIHILPPNLDYAATTALSDTDIIIGLDVIKDIGEETARRIVKYGNNFINNNKRVLEALIYSGCLDNNIQNRTTAYEQTAHQELFSEDKAKIRDMAYEIQKEIEHLGGILSNKYKIKKTVHLPIAYRSLFDSKKPNTYRHYLSSDNTLHIVCRIYDYRTTQYNNTVVYRVQAYDNFGLFEFMLPPSYSVQSMLHKDMLIKLRFIENKGFLKIEDLSIM